MVMIHDTTAAPGRMDFHHHFMPTSMLASELFGATARSKFRKDEGGWTPQISVDLMDQLGQ